MKPAHVNAPWEPYHVFMGRMVTEHSLKEPFDVSDELVMAGCSSNMTMKLCLSARLATLAINKMLALDA